MQKRLIYVAVFLFIVCGMILITNDEVVEKNNVTFEVFGNTTKFNNNPYIDQNNNIYISFDDIKQYIDPNIIFDKSTNRVVITTEDKCVKLKVGTNDIWINGEKSTLATNLETKDNKIYIPMKEFDEIYNINTRYYENSKTYVIDSNNSSIAKIKYNSVNIYSDIKTSSPIYKTLKKGDKVVVYIESLKHKRWYKIRDERGYIGYISKSSIEFISNPNTENEENQNINIDSKIVMFWQQGLLVDSIYTKPEGVTHISPWAYELIDNKGNFKSLITSEYVNTSRSKGYEIWPLYTNITTNQKYKENTSEIMNNEQLRENTINNIINTIDKFKFSGINLDFEAMKTEDKMMYSQFLRELKPFLKQRNCKLSVDIYFVSYLDRKSIGKIADYTVLMGYDQHWATSQEAGSVSELTWIDENITTLINSDKIPSNKIILGIPFYTRLWEEVNENGDAKIKSSKVYSMQTQNQYINSNNLTPIWDENAKQEYIEKKQGNTTYKMWLENSKSIKLRVNQVNEYNLAGVSAWRKGLETSDIWTAISETINK